MREISISLPNNGGEPQVVFEGFKSAIEVVLVMLGIAQLLLAGQFEIKSVERLPPVG